MSDDEHSRTDDTPTEPRDSEGGQDQATDTDEETMVESDRAAGERDTHDQHPDAETGTHDATHGNVEPATTRTTAPMSAFTSREAGIGVAVLVVGVLIAFVIPLLLV